MAKVFFYIFSVFISSSLAQRLIKEDEEVFNKTVRLYGPVQDYKRFGLPGPDIMVDDEKLNNAKTYFKQNVDGYILQNWSVGKSFSYVSHFENGTLRRTADEEIIDTIGQNTEIFQNEFGHYYLRTIGYTNNQSGYRQFLVDLSKLVIKTLVPVSGGPDGKKGIGSTQLIVLGGGTALG